MLADRPHGRGLTDAERRRLQDLERQLREDDPSLAAAFGGRAEGATAPGRVALAVAAAVACLLIVLAAMVAGVAGAAAVVVTLLSTWGTWVLLLRHRGPR